MSYAWTERLETGIPAIDSQHKELFAAINNLLDACAKGQSGLRIGDTLDFLNDYIIGHFEEERAAMERADYPDIEHHIRCHEDFRKSVKAVSDEYQEEGVSISLAAKVNSVLASWLVKHIEREDMRAAAYIRSTRKK